MDRKVVGLAMAVLCGAIALYCADLAAAHPRSDYGPLGLAFAVLSAVCVAVALSEGGSYESGSRDVHTEVHVHNHAPAAQPQQQQVQYIPVLQEAPPPQIVYVEREAAPPQQIGMAPEAVAQLVARMLEQRQPVAAARLERQPAPAAIEAEYRTLSALPKPGGKASPEPMRLAGPRKSIADRVAVALLTKPKGKEKS